MDAVTSSSYDNRVTSGERVIDLSRIVHFRTLRMFDSLPGIVIKSTGECALQINTLIVCVYHRTVVLEYFSSLSWLVPLEYSQ